MPLLEHFYATTVFHADVSDPNDLLVVAATWLEERRDSFDEREAIMATGASAADLMLAFAGLPTLVIVIRLVTSPAGSTSRTNGVCALRCCAHWQGRDSSRTLVRTAPSPRPPETSFRCVAPQA